MDRAEQGQLDRWFLRKFREMGIKPIPLGNRKTKSSLNKGIT